MTFSPELLLQQLRCYPQPHTYWVAYSGGLDSHVLMHALASLRSQLDAGIGAVHVNHGLQADARHWEEHCRRVCEGLGIRYVSLQVTAAAAAGESPEAAARVARYTALAGWLPARHCLLTAQHQDDQAETLLLQLLRGSGVHGLAAMPVMAVLGAGQHLRPLLAFARAQLHRYAESHRLDWVDDPSNTDTAFDRNYLRQQVMPVLRARWPAVAASLSRSALHCAEAADLVGQLGDQDCRNVTGQHPGALSLAGVCALPQARQRNVLRHWIRQATGTVPSTAVLARIVNDVLASRRDSGPCVRWGGYEVRRYRDELYLLHQAVVPDPGPELDWSMTGPLALPAAGGTLRVTPGTGRGIRAAAVGAAGVRVAWRQGGERCRPAGRGHRHALKKLFQERGIPPWERDRIPLIYIGDALAAVAGLWVCEPFQAGPAEPGLLIDWERERVTA
jgi:tRNA(Ile)-lysidine synthase